MLGDKAGTEEAEDQLDPTMGLTEVQQIMYFEEWRKACRAERERSRSSKK
jgi:hypothetical protein